MWKALIISSRQRTLARSGNASKMQNLLPTRFWKRVTLNPTTGCWLWTGRVRNTGYGDFWYEGKPWRAHRVAYRAFRDALPPILDHICEVRHCVNPDHLRPSSARENVLRSKTALCAIKARMTVCRFGHPLVFRKPNRRYCLICGTRRTRVRYHQKRPDARYYRGKDGNPPSA